jgi:hypothetical protein
VSHGFFHGSPNEEAGINIVLRPPSTSTSDHALWNCGIAEIADGHLDLSAVRTQLPRSGLQLVCCYVNQHEFRYATAPGGVAHHLTGNRTAYAACCTCNECPHRILLR